MKTVSASLCVALAAMLAFGLSPRFQAAEPEVLEGGVSDVAKIIPNLREGDMVFVQSHSSQAKFLTALTDSHMTHCGLLFMDKQKKWVVYEGAGMNSENPKSLANWREDEVKHKEGEEADLNIYVRRLKAPLSEDQVKTLKAEALKLHHTPYDSDFAWGNVDVDGRERIYCSELLYKAYERAKIGSLVALQTYAQLRAVPANLQKIEALHGELGEKIKARIHAAKADDPVVSPGDISRNTAILDVVYPVDHHP